MFVERYYYCSRNLQKLPKHTKYRRQTQPLLKSVTRSLHRNPARYIARTGMDIFDGRAKTHHKNIAARIPNHKIYDYLKLEVCNV